MDRNLPSAALLPNFSDLSLKLSVLQHLVLSLDVSVLQQSILPLNISILRQPGLPLCVSVLQTVLPGCVLPTAACAAIGLV
jgi:hypothetical protein